MATGFILFYLVIYLPLFIISLYLFIKAYKRRKKFEMVLFSICMLFCAYTIVSGIIASFKLEEIVQNLPAKFSTKDSTLQKAMMDSLLVQKIQLNDYKEEGFNMLIWLSAVPALSCLAIGLILFLTRKKYHTTVIIGLILLLLPLFIFFYHRS